MTRIEAVHDDEEDELETGNGWGWWMILPFVVLGLIVFQIADAAMTSVFDEEDE
jgi:hypothetical protein